MNLPRQLGPYRLDRLIGRGGMAEVFAATTFGASGFERTVAVKLLRPELADQPERLRLFLEEAKLGARLRHQHLISVEELSLFDGTYLCRMEYVDGADLARCLTRGPPGEPLALFLAQALAAALDYVHRAADAQGRPLGLVHRDVSPSNVLLSWEGEVKLGDFGLAKATALKDDTQARIRKGTYAYMAPEQLAGKPLTAAADQFSLGVLLHELLTGARPFDADGPLQTMESIRAAVEPPLPGLRPELAAVVRRCLRAAPAERYPSTAALRQALAALGGAADAAACATWVRAALSP